MSKEQIFELENTKATLLRQAYFLKQEHPRMSPISLEQEMYAAMMLEVEEITKKLQRVQSA